MKRSKTVLSVLSIAVIGLLALGLTSTPAYATAVTTTFLVTANVQATCLISAATLPFGTYSGTQIQTTSNISVTCTNATGYTVGLDLGANYSSTQRRMVGPSTNYLNYELFSDTLYSTTWGNAAGNWVSGTGNGAAQTLTVYGQLDGSQYPKVGAYTDTITATITY